MRVSRGYMAIANVIDRRNRRLERHRMYAVMFRASRFFSTCEIAERKLARAQRDLAQIERLNKRIAALPFWRRWFMI